MTNQERYGSDEILVPGTIRGFRGWKLARSMCLHSIGVNHEWLENSKTALCITWNGPVSHPVYEVPHEKCSCGIYACHSPDDFLTTSGYVCDDSCILGVIEAKGKIRVGNIGFRAQQANIVALSLGPFDSIGTMDNYFAVTETSIDWYIGLRTNFTISHLVNGLPQYRYHNYSANENFNTENCQLLIRSIRSAIHEAKLAEIREAEESHLKVRSFMDSNIIHYMSPKELYSTSIIYNHLRLGEVKYPNQLQLDPNLVVKQLEDRYKVPVFKNYEEMYAEFPPVPIDELRKR